jgi:transposase
VDCLVCAGADSARPVGSRKTDRRDAECLAQLLVAGELHRVTVPTVEAESWRDLVCARDDRAPI